MLAGAWVAYQIGVSWQYQQLHTRVVRYLSVTVTPGMSEDEIDKGVEKARGLSRESGSTIFIDVDAGLREGANLCIEKIAELFENPPEG